MVRPARCPKASQPTGPVPAGTSFVKAFFRLAGCSGTDAASCPVLRIIDYSSAAAVQSALAAWPHYFVATFARNVLRRAVSQYQVGGRPGLPGDLSQGAPQAGVARVLGEPAGCAPAWGNACTMQRLSSGPTPGATFAPCPAVFDQPDGPGVPRHKLGPVLRRPLHPGRPVRHAQLRRHTRADA